MFNLKDFLNKLKLLIQIGAGKVLNNEIFLKKNIILDFIVEEFKNFKETLRLMTEEFVYFREDVDYLFFWKEINIFFKQMNDEIENYLNQDFRNPYRRKDYKIGDIYMSDYDSYGNFSETIKEKFEEKSKDMWLEKDSVDYIFTRSQKHKFHIVSPSPWPFALAVSLFFLAIGAYCLLYRVNEHLIIVSLWLVIFSLSLWFRDIIREGSYSGYHTAPVQNGLRLAFTLFLVSEVMFFFSFFWAYFHIALSPNLNIGGIWPPSGIINFFFCNNINLVDFMDGNNKSFFSKPIFDIFYPSRNYFYNLAVNTNHNWWEELRTFSLTYKEIQIDKIMHFWYIDRRELSFIFVPIYPDEIFNFSSTFIYIILKSYTATQWLDQIYSSGEFIDKPIPFYIKLFECLNWWNPYNKYGVFPQFFTYDFQMSSNGHELCVVDYELYLMSLNLKFENFRNFLGAVWDHILIENISNKMDYSLTYKHLLDSTPDMGYAHQVFKKLDAFSRQSMDAGEILPKNVKTPSLIFSIYDQGVLINPFKKPLINTFILLTSGATITISHKLLKLRYYYFSMIFLKITIIFSYLFIGLQFMEYGESLFSINDGIYGSLFYVLTGFHGLHVIIGSCFLSVCFYRFVQQHFTPAVHLGYEFGIWYWHFVDVVWLFLYFTVYLWPNAYFFLSSHVSIFKDSASFAANINLNAIINLRENLREIFTFHYTNYSWEVTSLIISELLDNKYISKRFSSDMRLMSNFKFIDPFFYIRDYKIGGQEEVRWVSCNTLPLCDSTWFTCWMADKYYRDYMTFEEQEQENKHIRRSKRILRKRAIDIINKIISYGKRKGSGV